MYNKAEGDIRTGSSYKGGLAVWHYYDDHAVSSTSIKPSQIPRPDRLCYDNPNIQVASDDAARKLLISRTDPLCCDNENIARWIEEGDGGEMSVASHFEFLTKLKGNDVHVILSVRYFCLVRLLAHAANGQVF